MLTDVGQGKLYKREFAVIDKLCFWIGFSKVAGIGPARLRVLLDYYGDIEAAWRANPGELRAVGLDRRSAENLVKAGSN